MLQDSGSDLALPGVHFMVVEAGKGQMEFVKFIMKKGTTLFIDLDGILMGELSAQTGGWKVVVSGDDVQTAVQEAVGMRKDVSNLVLNSTNTLRVISQQKYTSKLWQRDLFKTLTLLCAFLSQFAPRLYFIHVESVLPMNERQIPRGVPLRLYRCFGEVWAFWATNGSEPSIRRL